jgi:hypothetical protein
MIHNHPPLTTYEFERFMKLIVAVAFNAPKGISCEALGVDTDQGGNNGIKIFGKNNKMFLASLFIGTDFKMTVFAGEIGDS